MSRTNITIEELFGIFYADEEEDKPRPREFQRTVKKEQDKVDISKLPAKVQEDYIKSQIALNKAEAARIKFDLNEAQRWAKDEEAGPDHHRIYTFYDDVREASVKKCMAQLDQWARRDPGEPITIVFNSPGGTVFDGLALFDLIETLRANGTHIETVALGMAASMGGILLQAGEHRVMGRNAWLMIHEISSVALGKASELEDEVKLIKKLQDRALDILAGRSNMTKAEIARKWKRKDWWLTAEEALELGFCDEIR